MNDNFKIIYRILSYLNQTMGNERNLEKISHEQFAISFERWANYIAMLIDSGYVSNARVFTNTWGETKVEMDDIRITLKGLEYLSENTIMQRIYKSIKGITDIVK